MELNHFYSILLYKKTQSAYLRWTVTIQLWIKYGISASLLTYEVVNTNFASFSAKFKIVTSNLCTVDMKIKIIMDGETKRCNVIFNMFNMTIIYPNFKLIKLVQCMACELFIKNTCFVFFNWTNKCSVHMELSNTWDALRPAVLVEKFRLE